MLGVNRFVEPDEKPDIELHPHDPSTAERQIARPNRVRRERDEARIDALLDQLVATANDASAEPAAGDHRPGAAGASMGDIVEG